MIPNWAVIVVWVYFSTGMLAYGGMLAHQRAHSLRPFSAAEYWLDVAFSLTIGMCGPLGLVIAWGYTSRFKDGLKFL